MTFVSTLLVIHITIIVNVESYTLKCPVNANWIFRANLKCNSTSKYFCLYNNVDEKYVEGCDGPDWDRKGSKRIFSVSFTRGQCIRKRYQPLKFHTDEGMSDCIYAKSLCSEEGQVVHNDDSAKNDTTCRCDYKNNYSFMKTPRHICYCIPTEEDCSCYTKACPVNSTLTTDYECSSNSNQENQICKAIIPYVETIDGKIRIHERKDNFLLNESVVAKLSFYATTPALSVVCLCCICVAVIFFFAVLFQKWTSEKLQSMNKHSQITHTGIISTQTSSIVEHAETQVDENGIEFENGANKTDRSTTDITSTENIDGLRLDTCESTATNRKLEYDTLNVRREHVDVEVIQPSQFAKPKDENNFLRMIHLLSRLVCPIVRTYFDREIQPKLLRKTLDKHMHGIKKRYRKKETIISDGQWKILFGQDIGKPVTSYNFDIRLMIYLLGTIARKEVGDLYPVSTDTSDSAMLSRILYINNDVTQSIDGKLPAKTFNMYWDDLGQAILTLVSPHIDHIDKYTEKKQLIDRLFTLNPINIDQNKLCKFKVISEIYPLMILRTFISQYCTLNNTTIAEILRKEKHQLYHKRLKTEKCCVCADLRFATFIKVLPEKHWSALYDMIDDTNSHACPLHLKICIEQIVPKKTFDIDTCNVSLAMSLILYIPRLLRYFVCHLCVNGFEKFLTDNKHTLYHSMDQRKCCKCSEDPTEKTMISEEEWNKMFLKDEYIICKTGIEDCCCQFFVRDGTKYSNIEDILLSKVIYCAGPFDLINKIEQNGWSYFLRWTRDDQSIRRMLDELCNVLSSPEAGDTILSTKVFDQTSTGSLSELEESTAQTIDAQEWISRHLQEHKLKLEPVLQMLFLDRGCLQVRGIHIPKDLTSSDRVRKFDEITSEENNFLVVVHTLKAIVLPVIKIQLLKTCPHDDIHMILMQIYYGKHYESKREGRKMNSMYLSERRRKQLFSPTKDDSENLDLELMIYILKQRTENISIASSQSERGNQLDAINQISMEMMQSSSGILEKKSFQDIMQIISEAVSYFEGDEYMEELSQLQNIENILEMK